MSDDAKWENELKSLTADDQIGVLVAVVDFMSPDGREIKTKTFRITNTADLPDIIDRQAATYGAVSSAADIGIVAGQPVAAPSAKQPGADPGGDGFQAFLDAVNTFLRTRTAAKLGLADDSAVEAAGEAYKKLWSPDYLPKLPLMSWL